MFYTRTARNEIENERWKHMQGELRAIYEAGPTFASLVNHEIGRLMHEQLYRTGHPLVRNSKGAGNG